jgi:hypothetical protein
MHHAWYISVERRVVLLRDVRTQVLVSALARGRRFLKIAQGPVHHGAYPASAPSDFGSSPAGAIRRLGRA